MDGSERDRSGGAEGECKNSQAKGSDSDDTSESAGPARTPKGQPEAGASAEGNLSGQDGGKKIKGVFLSLFLCLGKESRKAFPLRGRRRGTGSPEKVLEKKTQEKKTQEAAICTFWAETLSHGKSVFPKVEPISQTAERIQLLQILSPVRTVSRAEFPSGRGFPRHSMLKHRFLRRAHHPHIAIKSIIRIH